MYVPPSPPPPPPLRYSTLAIGTRPGSGVSTARTSASHPTMSSSGTHIVIGGVCIPIAATKKIVSDATTAFYKKADSDSLNEDKFNDISIKAVALGQKKYDFINLKLDDPELLEDTYNLEIAIEKTKSNHSRFDMNDVFTIVDPDNGYTEIDLYTSHSTLTEADVTKSNEWYQTMTEDQNNKWFCQNMNMNLIYEYFIFNMEDKLATKVKETYLKYPVEQRGGPLFFKIMIDIL